MGGASWGRLVTPPTQLLSPSQPTSVMERDDQLLLFDRHLRSCDSLTCDINMLNRKGSGTYSNRVFSISHSCHPCMMSYEARFSSPATSLNTTPPRERNTWSQPWAALDFRTKSPALAHCTELDAGTSCNVTVELLYNGAHKSAENISS